MNRARILLTEDDPNLGLILQENLEQEGFAVELCADGDAAKVSYLRGGYDLCLIDVMLPKRDGFTLARDIRKIDAKTPIIFLTAKSLKADRIEGLRIGADDYMVKPFSMEELVLRIRAVLKRSLPGSHETSDTSWFTIGKYEFDSANQTLTLNGIRRKLTYKESELLKLFCLHRNEILERELALHTIWGDDTFFNARSMDVFVTKLRKYLKEDLSVEIMNIHGRGFKMKIEDRIED